MNKIVKSLVMVAVVIGLLFMVVGGIRNIDAAEKDAITITADPSLPVKNYLQNAGFEKEGEGNDPEWWKFQEHAPTMTGCRTTKDAHSGKASVKITGTTPDAYGAHTVWVGFNKPYPRQVLLSGWMKGEISKWAKVYCTSRYEISGKRDGAAGIKEGLSPTEWRFANTIIEYQDEGIKGIAIQLLVKGEGTVYFDDITVSEAYTDLSYVVNYPNIKQVILLDSKGEVIKDSGILPKGVNTYRRTEVVSTQADYYTVRVIAQGGKILEKSYPEK